jgi:hypothetical protein
MADLLKGIALCLLHTSLLTAQVNGFENCGAKAEGNLVSHALKLDTIGDLKLPGGHHGAFRIYEAADGTTARIAYVRLPSLKDATQLIQEWLKLATKVESREHDTKRGQLLINDRIVARRKVVKSSKGESMLIRRDALNCYLIESPSMQVALQVEDTIAP